MRQFIISAFERLVWVLVLIILIASVVGGVAMMFMPSGPGMQGPGVLGGLLMMIGGAIYAIIVGGMMFMVIGVYENTKRCAEALERMSKLG